MQLTRLFGDVHPDRGAAGDGLHHHRQLGALHNFGDVLLRHRDGLPPGGFHLAGYQPLGEVLVHGDGGAQAARAGVGRSQKVQSGLDAAVLAAGAVEGQIDHVRPGAHLQNAVADGGGAGPAGPQLLQVGGLPGHPLVRVGNGGHIEIVPIQRPIQAVEQVHQRHLMAPVPQGLAHHSPG